MLTSVGVGLAKVLGVKHFAQGLGMEGGHLEKQVLFYYCWGAWAGGPGVGPLNSGMLIL